MAPATEPTPKATETDEIGLKLATIHRDAEERDAEHRAAALGIPYVDIRKSPISIEALTIIPESDSSQLQLVSIELKDRLVALAAAHPTSADVQARITQLKSEGYTTKLYLASNAAIAEAQLFYKYVAKKTEDITGEVKVGGPDMPKSFQELTKRLQETDFTTVSTTTLFQEISSGALASGASDIHIESKDDGALLRLRIDGILHDVVHLPRHGFITLINRIKLLSRLKLNVRDEAQDGRFTIKIYGGSSAEVRVSIIPADTGEVIVMRILDPNSLAVDVTKLGLRPDDEKLILEELKRPNGIVLNTGPTGSGKTTTLYSFLQHISNSEVKVITLEDPIEYKLPGIDQTQVDPDGGYTFALGLRSILRQDPDVILVGEIRDGETAETALQAALTGHLVFSTLHTNSALGAIPRLVDLGVRPATIAPAMNVVIAQRLVRRLCVCKKEQPRNEALQSQLAAIVAALPERVDKKLYEEALAKKIEFVPGSCDICNGFGYKGRIAIFEFLQVTEAVKAEIGKDTSEITLHNVAAAQGMVPMQHDGVLKAILGVTTIDEVIEVTGPIV
jgi:type IV pilus assembly protein PilB